MSTIEKLSQLKKELGKEVYEYHKEIVLNRGFSQQEINTKLLEELEKFKLWKNYQASKSTTPD